jgi:Tat protein translocase TatB subunit
MFGTLGGPELFLILVVALIVFGPRKLPDIGKSVGKMMAEFRKASNDFRRTIEDEVEAEKIREATRLDVPSWTSPEPAALPPASEPAPSSADPAEGGSPPTASGEASEASAASSPSESGQDGAAPPDTVSRETLAEPK